MDSEKVTYWKVAHSPDLTETGLPMQRTYIRAVWVGHPAQENTRAVLENFCLARFGSRTSYVQGVAPVPTWELFESTEEKFRAGEGVRWGGYENKPTRLEVRCGRRSSQDPEYTDAEVDVQSVRMCPHCGKPIPEVQA